MRETRFWALLEGHLLGQKERIENALTRGTPDVYTCHIGKSRWLELKTMKDPDASELTPKAFDDISKSIRPEQYLWHYKHRLNGGISFFLVRNSTHMFIFRTTTPKLLELVATLKKPFDWALFQRIIY